MVWLSYKTAARLLQISVIEVVLLARSGFFRAKRHALCLKKNCWNEPKYVEFLKLAVRNVGGW